MHPLIPLTTLALGWSLATAAAPAQVIPVGRGPTDVVAADLDGDARADLIAANGQDGTVSLLRGNDEGRFEPFPGAPVAAGHDPSALAIGDFDGDGNLDVAVANHETRYLTLLAGDGGGGLSAAPDSPLTIDVDPHPHLVLAVDLDGDARLDLVVDDRNRHGVLALYGRGDGGFVQPGRRIPVGGDPYLGMAVADLNGDGRPDLVSPNRDEVGVVLALPAGRAAFAAPVSLPVASPDAVGCGDFDGDGRNDLIVASQPARGTLYLGDGDGGFRPHPGGPWSTGGGQAKKLEVGDLNGDGLADAVVLGWTEAYATVIFGHRERPRRATLPTGRNPWGLEVADLNGDGRDDVAVASHAEGTVAVFISSAEGSDTP